MSVEDEAAQTYAAYVRTRSQVLAGEAEWSSMAEFFTDDAVFIDPAWGRVEGNEAIADFMAESMAGLDDWDFPEVWTMVDDRRVVSMWDQVLPADDDGHRRRQPGISVLYYAGDGRFCYEMDLLNMTHVLADLGASGWAPAGDFNLPPSDPNRDWSLGASARYLDDG